MSLRKAFNHNVAYDLFHFKRGELMETFAATIYVICDEILKALHVEDDHQAQMSNAEIMTFALIAAKFFRGNHKFCRYLCKRLGFFPKILSGSRINRRLHLISWDVWHAVFRLLALCFKGDHGGGFAVDSFPVACCEKSRIDRRKIFLERKYLGYAPSKKKYFCGIKIHMLVNRKGQPIEAVFQPGSQSDINILWKMELDIPQDSVIYADGAYNCFELEDILREEQINLLAKRGSRAKKRVRSSTEEKAISSKRQTVETTFSCITDLFPRNLRFRTERGFLLKIFCFILAYSTSFVCN